MLYKNFINKIYIICKSGNGGHGCVHFLRNFKKIGKPDGGNGGNGGNIIFIGNNNLFTLYNFKFKKFYKANNGKNGKNNCKTGKNGKDCIIYVPLYTLITYLYKNEKKSIIIKKHNQKKILLYGGKGGKGNNFYKSSKDQKSKKYSLGKKGKKILIKLELKIKIDVTLIGYPNTGKSTILSKLTNTKPKIGNYDYTTIIPNIGVYNINYNNYLIMDIPAIIENTYLCKGVGSKYINYLNNNKLILIVIVINKIKNILKNYNIIKKEINFYNIKINNKIIILSKYDYIKKKNKKIIKKYFKKNKINYCFFSKYKKKSINNLKKKINKILLK
ncbi:MAG: Obg family GTPase CgtA [Candidatus Shikimatogenerans sp. JK-2022]|nr:Obg family GTPase CgtA [Candidatus Shikimatogenerans bostrichidophilus]